MKNLLLLILITYALPTKAQTSIYHPFPDSNAVWNVNYSLYWCNLFDPFNEQYSYLIDGDTTINSTTYHKIISPFIEKTIPTCTSYVNRSGYKGCIRQDTTLKQVYLIPGSNNVEEILYDFSLQVGDTLNGYLFQSCPAIVVISIDSILIDNSFRKRWWVMPTFLESDSSSIIEGIGFSIGLFEYSCIFIDGPTTLLTCFRQNGNTLYPNFSTTCDIITTNSNIPELNSTFSFYPNPFHSTATFNSNTLKAKLKIYNTFGKIERIETIISHSITINRNGLSDGIYFYQLVNENGLIANGKFIIE